MTKPSVGGEVHRADRAYRKQLLAWLGLTAVASAILLFALNQWLGELNDNLGHADPQGLDAWLRRLLAGVGLVFATVLLAASAWMRRVATATLAEHRWPPSGMRTAEDIPVRYLSSADAQARQLRFAAQVLTGLAVAVLLWAAWVVWPAL